VFEPAIHRIATTLTVDMLGFWTALHLHGGFEGLVELGMHLSTAWRKVKRFRMITGQHRDDFDVPGVTLDRAKYLDWARAHGGSLAEKVRG
jgi:hypothetical protein